MEVVFHENLSSDDEVQIEEVQEDYDNDVDNDIENQTLTPPDEEFMAASVIAEDQMLQDQQHQKRHGCCSPYAALFLVLVYVVICFLFAQPNPECGTTADCEASFWSSAFALDFFICAVTIVLGFHLWLVGRNETACLAFACLAFGFLVRGVLIKDATAKGYSVVRSRREFYIATLAYYVLWTISAVFFQRLVAQAWQRLVHKPKRCGAVESKLMLVFLIFAATIVVIGGILGALDVSVDMILNIGRIAWHVAYFAFFLAASVMWTSLASEQTVRIWGLPNSKAGTLLTTSLLLTCLSWIVEVAWDASLGSACFVLLAYLGILLTVFFTHNVILSVICPFEIFIDEDEMSQIMIMSSQNEQMQAMDFVSNLQKPVSSNPMNGQKARGAEDEDIPDTESSSYADSDFGDVGTANDTSSSKRRNMLMFFSMFRARRSALQDTSPSKGTNRTEQHEKTLDQSTHEMLNSRTIKMISPTQLEQFSSHSRTVEEKALTDTPERTQQSQILFEKFSCESSVSSTGTTKNIAAACIPTCGIVGWTLASQSTKRQDDDNSRGLELHKKASKLLQQGTADEQPDIENGVKTSNDDLSESASFDGGFSAWISSLLPATLFLRNQENSRDGHRSTASLNNSPNIDERVVRDIENLDVIDRQLNRSDKTNDDVMIPGELAIDRSSMDDDSKSVVSQLTKPIEAKQRISLTKSKSQQKDRTSSFATVSSETMIPAMSRTTTGGQGKYKTMLKQTYAASLARSQLTEGTSKESSISNIESEASLSMVNSESPSSTGLPTFEAPESCSPVVIPEFSSCKEIVEVEDTCENEEKEDGGIEVCSKDHEKLLNESDVEQNAGFANATAEAPKRRKSLKIPFLWSKKKSKKGNMQADQEKELNSYPSQQDSVATSTAAASTSSNLEAQSSQEIEIARESMEDKDAQKIIPILTYIESEPTEKTIDSKVLLDQSTRTQQTSDTELSDPVRDILLNDAPHDDQDAALEKTVSSNQDESAVPISLLDELSVNMHMTETEDEGEDIAFGLWKQRSTAKTEDVQCDEEVPEKQADTAKDLTILHAIESSGSDANVKSVENKTGDDDSNLKADLSFLHVESESDHSSLAASRESSMLSASTSAESDDFLNSMLNNLMVSSSEDTTTTGSSSTYSESGRDERIMCSGTIEGPEQASCSPEESPDKKMVRCTTEEKVGVALMRSLNITKEEAGSPEKATTSIGKAVPSSDASETVASITTVTRSDSVETSDRLEKVAPIESSTGKKSNLYLVHLPPDSDRTETDATKGAPLESTGLNAKSSLPSKQANEEAAASIDNDQHKSEASSSLLEQELDRLVEAASQSSSDERIEADESFKAGNIVGVESRKGVSQAEAKPRRRRSSRKQMRKMSSSLSGMLETIEESKDEAGGGLKDNNLDVAEA